MGLPLTGHPISVLRKIRSICFVFSIRRWKEEFLLYWEFVCNKNNYRSPTLAHFKDEMRSFGEIEIKPVHLSIVSR